MIVPDVEPVDAAVETMLITSRLVFTAGVPFVKDHGKVVNDWKFDWLNPGNAVISFGLALVLTAFQGHSFTFLHVVGFFAADYCSHS
jgi:hypothetical protein